MITSNMQCKVCESSSLPLATAVVLNKHSVQYYSCSHCGFIQTESPYWLEEAYSSAIARSDIGLIGRNIKLSSLCSAMIPMLPGGREPFLDYGGGNGMFVRMMRDKGFDFYWHDKYASNEFAQGFEATPRKEFAILTAFEVFEHLPNPLDSIQEMFDYSNTVIFSTRLLPRRNISPYEWWYFTLDTGQHVSLYSRETLEIIAKKFKVKLSSNGVSHHLLSVRTIPTILMQALSFSPFANLVDHVLNIGRRSLLEQDYFQLTGKTLD